MRIPVELFSYLFELFPELFKLPFEIFDFFFEFPEPIQLRFGFGEFDFT